MLSLFLPGPGSSQDVAPPTGCPRLPEHGVANKISLYVGKRLDAPGSVCVRVVNGLQGLGADIRYGASAFWLQKWEDKEGKFRGLEEPDLHGGLVAVPLIAYTLPGGEMLDERLPYSHQPAPAGRYRVRFRFRMPGQGVHQELYSEEFTLP